MTSGQRIVKNSLILFSSHVLTKIINLFLVIILTRMLGTNGFGIYNFSQAFVTLFMVLGNLGINSLLTRDVARDKSQINQFLGKSIPLLLYLSLGVFILINITVSLISWDPISIAAIRIFSIFLVLDNFSRHFISVFRAFERMEFEAYTNLIERMAMLIIAVMLWYLGKSLIFLLWCFVVIELLKAGTALTFMRHFFKKIEWSWFHHQTYQILQEAFPFALMMIFGTIAVRIDTVMLKIFHNEQIVGFYSAAHKLIESLTFIPENIVLALYPALSVLFLNNKYKFKETFTRSLKYLFLIGMPVSAGIFVLAEPIILLLFEVEYSPATIALRWLSIALGLIFIKYHFMITLNAIGKQRQFAKVAGIAMFVNVLFNLLLIPKYDLLGASLATIGSELMAVILGFLLLFNISKGVKLSSYILKTAIATIVMTIILQWLSQLNLFLLIFIGTLSYFIPAFILGIIHFSDIQYFKKLLQDKFAKQ